MKRGVRGEQVVGQVSEGQVAACIVGVWGSAGGQHEDGVVTSWGRGLWRDCMVYRARDR